MIENEAGFISLKLAKLGYYGGDPVKVLRAPVDVVLRIIQFEKFERDLVDWYRQQQPKEIL